MKTKSLSFRFCRNERLFLFKQRKMWNLTEYEKQTNKKTLLDKKGA